MKIFYAYVFLMLLLAAIAHAGDLAPFLELSKPPAKPAAETIEIEVAKAPEIPSNAQIASGLRKDYLDGLYRQAGRPSRGTPAYWAAMRGERKPADTAQYKVHDPRNNAKDATQPSKNIDTKKQKKN